MNGKFHSSDFSLKDEKRSGRPVEIDDDLIKTIIDSDRHSTTREIAENCDLLKESNGNDPFLKRLISGDEKWVVYNNIKWKILWSRPGEPTQTTSKADIHQKKVLLSVWWDYKGFVYFELLPPNRTINSDVYIEQITKINNAVEEKRPELTNRKGDVFHHDNARTHTSLVTRQKLLELGWNVLPHPPCIPDLAPPDYFLFRSLQNSLNDTNFNTDDDVKSYLNQFFANKNHKFYERGIMMLPQRRQKIIDQNGQYITE
ncbi:histone-lysine N-methyltransferase SETMAR [Trichonephila clavipes]|nr:histone-lysine N-methyltransferase SETMAR [Trichonephila clavipes]